jgi:hypothetical protein
MVAFLRETISHDPGLKNFDEHYSPDFDFRLKYFSPVILHVHQKRKEAISATMTMCITFLVSSFSIDPPSPSKWNHRKGRALKHDARRATNHLTFSNRRTAATLLSCRLGCQVKQILISSTKQLQMTFDSKCESICYFRIIVSK